MRVVFLLMIIQISAGAQSLLLTRGVDTFEIRRNDEITIFSEKKGLRNDSLELMARGELLDFRLDTVLLIADEYVRHDFYKKGDDSLHYIDEVLVDSVIFLKFPAKEITGIFYHRKKLSRTVTRIVYITLGTSLATLPLVLTLDPGEARDIISGVNIVSTATMLGAAATGIVFSKRKFWTQPKYKKSWAIQRQGS